MILNKKQSSVVLPVAIIVGALVVRSRMTTAPASASMTGNDTTTTPTSGLELSAQPVWVEHAKITGVTPINETHSSVTFSGNGTLTLPNTTQTINTPATVAHLSHLQQNLVKER